MVEFVLTDRQYELIDDKTRFLLITGSAGSGKTIFCCFKTIMYAVEHPKARVGVFRKTLPSLRETAWREIRELLIKFGIEFQENKSSAIITLNNGSTISFTPLDTDEKIRSLNLTAFWIVEASGVDYKIFTQLQTRLRNRAAIVKDSQGHEIEHRFIGIVESNPEEGWIRDEFLLRSGKIFASRNVDISSYSKLKTKKPEKSYHSFLSASVDNKYLPKTFISDMCVGKSEKWIRKYIYCFIKVFFYRSCINIILSIFLNRMI